MGCSGFLKMALLFVTNSSRNFWGGR